MYAREAKKTKGEKCAFRLRIILIIRQLRVLLKQTRLFA